MTTLGTVDTAASANLLRAAVRHDSASSGTRILERLFTYAFSDLVYPQIWEDPAVDLEAMQLEPTSRIVTIASGGCNILNYLTANPQSIHAVDLNSAHIALNRLKMEVIRQAPDYETLFRFFGTASIPENAAYYKYTVAPHLDAVSRGYWETQAGMFKGPRYEQFAKNFYRHGLLGRFIGIAHAVSKAYGVDPKRMLDARSRAEQIEIFDNEIAPLFQKSFVRGVLGYRAALYGLGIPPAQYDALLAGHAHMADVVCARLRKLACDFDLKDNYFAWQAFARSYPQPGAGPLPPYLQATNFADVKARIDRASVQLISMTEFLAHSGPHNLDRYVLLDAQDWMDDQALNALWREITRTARAQARVIFRTAGAETILPGRVQESVLSQWHYHAEQSRDLTQRDRSAIYGGFHLYSFKTDLG